MMEPIQFEFIKKHSETLTKFATFASLRYSTLDPEVTAGHVMHYLEQILPANAHRFVDREGQPDPEKLLPWCRIIMRHRIIALRAKQSPSEQELNNWTDQGNIAMWTGPIGYPRIDLENSDDQARYCSAMLELLIMLDEKAIHAWLILGKLAGYSRQTLAEELAFVPSEANDSSSCASQTWSDFFGGFPSATQTPNSSFRQRPQPVPYHSRPSVLGMEIQIPDRDDFLATTVTPNLAAALMDLSGEMARKLLHILTRSQWRQALLPFIYRLAGIWDCVIAHYYGVPLNVHRTFLTELRNCLEELLAVDIIDDMAITIPTYPDYSGNAYGHSSSSPVASHATLHDKGGDAMHQLCIQLKSRAIRNALALGRRRQIPGALFYRNSSDEPLAERLWTWASEIGNTVLAPIVVQPLKVPMRSEDERVQGLSIQLPSGFTLSSIMVFQVVDLHCHLVYPTPRGFSADIVAPKPLTHQGSTEIQAPVFFGQTHTFVFPIRASSKKNVQLVLMEGDDDVMSALSLESREKRAFLANWLVKKSQTRSADAGTVITLEIPV